MKKYFYLLPALLSLSACTAFDSDYIPPVLSMPESYQRNQESTAATQLPDRWWTAFHDETLTNAIDTALAKNNDLSAAAIRLQRALYRADLAEENRDPAVTGNLSTGRTLDLNDGGARNSSGGTISVSYQTDLFRKLARAEDAAAFEAIATQQDYESVAQSLAVTTASLYWQNALLSQLLVSRKASLDYAQKTYDLVRIQREAGAASGLELAEAAQSLSSQRASYTDIAQQKVEAENAFAILFDAPPAAMDDKTAGALPTGNIPAVAAGIPANILKNRPDLRAAEYRLQSALANVDVARASLLPDLALTGSAGTSSNNLITLLQNPVATLGAGIALPFLQWDIRNLDIKVSKTVFEEAVVNYRQTVYQALSDVENALSAKRQLELKAAELETALTAAEKSAALYELRYKAGAVELRIWLDAQERARQSRDALLQNRYDRLVNYATLCMALGGKAI